MLRQALITAAVAALSSGLLAGSASPASGRWGDAIEVPGIARQVPFATVTSIACPALGDCVAGGYYAAPGTGPSFSFLAEQRGGRWGRAFKLPGTLPTASSGAWINAVSCSSAGNCAAGGVDNNDPEPAILIGEYKGRWGKGFNAAEALNKNAHAGYAQVLSVSCPSAGNCAAGGWYIDNTPAMNMQAFVISERGGRWQKAINVPGTLAHNTGGEAQTLSISCPSAGDCSAGGYYKNRWGLQPFVVSERRGHWGKAIQVPGSGPLNRGGSAQTLSISCPSEGNCSAGGFTEISRSHWRLFAASQRNGTWHRALLVPGPAIKEIFAPIVALSLSCYQGDNCMGAAQNINSQTILIAQRNGRWSLVPHIPMPANAAPNSGYGFFVSCQPNGTCTLAGTYSDGHRAQVMVVSRRNGRWGKATEIRFAPGLDNSKGVGVAAISCARRGGCGAGGAFAGASNNSHAFVVTQSSP